MQISYPSIKTTHFFLVSFTSFGSGNVPCARVWNIFAPCQLPVISMSEHITHSWRLVMGTGYRSSRHDFLFQAKQINNPFHLSVSVTKTKKRCLEAAAVFLYQNEWIKIDQRSAYGDLICSSAVSGLEFLSMDYQLHGNANFYYLTYFKSSFFFLQWNVSYVTQMDLE